MFNLGDVEPGMDYPPDEILQELPGPEVLLPIVEEKRPVIGKRLCGRRRRKRKAPEVEDTEGSTTTIAETERTTKGRAVRLPLRFQV